VIQRSFGTLDDLEISSRITPPEVGR